MLHQKKGGMVPLSNYLTSSCINPLVIAMLISLLVILTDIEIPDFVTNIIYFIAQSGALVCLFVIGGTLFGVTLSNYGFKMYGIVLGKLFFFL